MSLAGVSYAQVPKVERDALAALYNSTDGVNWIENTGWMKDAGTECLWVGVNCVNDSVSTINLQKNSLTGTIPASLGNLTNLQTLALGDNTISGSIPSELGNLTNLTYLSLYKNTLSGGIPGELGNLTNLTTLYLDSNTLSGSIPAELGNLTNLTSLFLYGNTLSGGIPGELGNLTNLTELYLDGNTLSGGIPADLGNLTNLIRLDLARNTLSGSIPTELGNLTNLTALYLDSNTLSGSIPAELGNLTNLTYLSLSQNSLTGIIPSKLGNLALLEGLYLESDAAYRGSLPDNVKNLPNLKTNDFDRLAFIGIDSDYDGISDDYDENPSRPDQYKRIKAADYSIIFSESGVIVNLVHPRLHTEIKGGSSREADREIAKIIYEHFEDQFDLLMVAPVTKTPSSVNYNTLVKPIASGLESDMGDFDISSYFGSKGELNNYVFLTHPRNIGKLGVATHEIMHIWAAPPMFLSTNSGHNGYSNVGGILGGWKPNTLKALGDRVYQVETIGDESKKGAIFPNGVGPPTVPYSNFELYLAGLIAPEEVGYDLKLARGFTWLDLDERTFSATSIETTSIDDFIKANGPRLPNSLDSQKVLEAMQVIVSDQALTIEQITEYNDSTFWLQLARNDGDDQVYNFWESTRGKARLVFNQTDHLIAKATNYRAGNLPPTIDAFNIERVIRDLDGIAGENVTLTPILSDDTGIESVKWLIDGEVVATGTKPDIDLKDGINTLTIQVTDDDFDVVSTTISIQVMAPFTVDSTWNKEFNGVSPDASLGIAFNNIGSYDFSKKIISSCLRLTTNGEPFSYNGITQLEGNFVVVSDELGIIKLTNSRSFNSLNLLTSANEKPDCSGEFDTQTNVYKDTIETTFSYAGLQSMQIDVVKTFDMSFKLYDGEKLLFKLESFKELSP